MNGVPFRFTVAPRLTLLVRHSIKHFEMPIDLEQAFIFTDNGTPTGEYARTLHELAISANSVDSAVISGHVKRHDFANWISNTLKDRDLANVVRKLESQHCTDGAVSTFPEKLSTEIERQYNHSSK